MAVNCCTTKEHPHSLWAEKVGIVDGEESDGIMERTPYWRYASAGLQFSRGALT